MNRTNRNMLVISPDPQVTGQIGTALAAIPALKVDCETATLAQMNGRAAKLAAQYDIVLFQTGSEDDAELEAVRALAAARRPGGVILALAEDDISLSRARALSHAGVDEVIPAGAGAELGAQVSRLGLAAPVQGGGGHHGRIIAVTQARGGIGATTVAVNLADRLARERRFLHRENRHPVALVDLDLQFGTVGSMLDLPEQDALLTLAQEGTLPDATFLRQSMHTTPGGISVLPAPGRFAPIDALRPEQVAAILDTLRQAHDYVIVDLPRALVGWIEPVLARADRVLVVTDTSVPAIRHCRRLIDFFQADNLALPVEIVVNREARSLSRAGLRRAAEKVLERKLGHWLPLDASAARTAADRGRPLSDVSASGRLSRAIARLAQDTRAALPPLAQAASQ